MVKRPSLSVIMPCFNTEEYVYKAIKSILEQSFSDLELIIINDGSTDDTHTEIKKFTDNRIRYILNTSNTGNYPSRNIGLNMARGKYIAVMDSDDIALPDRLKIQRKYLQQHTEVGCIGTMAKLINKNGEVYHEINSPSDYSDIKIALLKNNCLLHPSLMLRHSFIKKHNLTYNTQLKYSADYDLMVRCCRYFPVYTISRNLMKYRIHPKQISSNKRREQAAYADQVRLQQLTNFNISISEKEKSLHLKLMRGNYLDDEELKKATAWLNKLLEANEKTNLYNSTKLYGLFEYVLKLAVNRNNLGGWSIEKKIS